MAPKGKRSAGGLSRERLAGLDRLAARLNEFIGSGTTVCFALDRDDHPRFGLAAPSGRVQDEGLDERVRTMLAEAARSGETALLAKEDAASLGGETGFVVPLNHGADAPNACVVLDQDFSVDDPPRLKTIGDRIELVALMLGELQAMEHDIRALSQTAGAFRALVENASDAVMVLDLDGRVRAWNRSCEALYGFSAADAIGQVAPSIPKERLQETVAHIRELAAAGRVVQEETRCVRADGSTITVDQASVPLTDRDGLPVGVVELGRRVTADSQLSRMQDEFAALASQQLKGPLTAIMGYAQLLNRPEIAEDAIRRGRTVKALEQRAHQLAGFVDDLFLVARIEHGQMRLELARADLPGIVTDAVTHFEQFDTGHGFVIDVDTGIPEFDLDARRVEQALGYLLSNAVTYSPPGDDVFVSVVQDADEAVVSVTDRGAGIRPEEAERVFERFYKGKDAEGTGVGIGLHLAKMIVEAHGGEVSMETTPGRATTFYMRLPLRRDTVAGVEPTAEEGP